MFVKLLFCCVLSANVLADTELRIGAFNVQVFGRSKSRKPEVMETLAKIVSRYDVILIQEIRDSSMTAIKKLLDQVNNLHGSPVFHLKLSERLGRTRSKEQYAFFYRAEKLEVSTYQYKDVSDFFEREPYSILLTSTESNTDSLPFFLAGIHIKPSKAFEEMNGLDDVYDELVGVFNTTSGVILGDMNAGCKYLREKNYQKLDLVTDSRFTWLIDSSEDTTTTATNCSYDRIVVAGDILAHIVRNSASVFRFDEMYGLTQKQSKAVSDHYPVEFSVIV